MDALFAKASAIRPHKRRRFNGDGPHTKKHTGKDVELDSTAKSVLHHTSLPKSLRPGSPPPEEANKYSHISDKKLRAQLSSQSAHSARSKALLEDAAFLLEHEDSGAMEAEGELDRTWRVGQDEIAESAGQEAAKSRREWKLDGGPYRSRYTRNGRYIRPHSMQHSIFLMFAHPLGISLLLVSKVMWLPSTGRQEHCILNYNSVRPAVISRSCIKHSLSSLV
jgi:U3 small nucleolar RNA-associated protein 7